MDRIFKKVKKMIQSDSTHFESPESVHQLGQINQAWWGALKTCPGQARFWRIGDVIILVDCLKEALHIAHFNVLQTEQPLAFRTFTFKSPPEIWLYPVLANRALASKLARPLFVPGGEEILLYVSSPVWIRLETQKTKLILEEVASSTLTDTWFGPNTLEGELCYAGKTFCSSNLTELPQGPNRIISPMLIRNRASEVLPLVSISVPLPFLSVYQDPNNHLWTEQLNLQRQRSFKAEIKVAKGPPKGSTQLELLSKPRIPLKSSTSFKLLLHSLIGS